MLRLFFGLAFDAGLSCFANVFYNGESFLLFAWPRKSGNLSGLKNIPQITINSRYPPVAGFKHV